MIVSVVLIVRLLQSQSHNLTLITTNILKMSAEMKQRLQDIVSGTREYPVKSKSFWLPNLEQIASYVEFELKKNYSKVLVCNVMYKVSKYIDCW